MPRTLAQNAQYIAETIKPAIKSAIEAQGVTVPSTDSFLDYADRIAEIEGGGSGYQLKDLPTGSISTVNDAEELPLNALKVSVEAVQDLHGYDHPWAGGAGKNKFNKNGNLINGKFIQADGTLASSPTWNTTDYQQITPNTYTMSGATTKEGAYYGICWYDSEKTYMNGYQMFTSLPQTITIPSNAQYVRYSVSNSTLDSFMLEQGSVATSYEPYSNICPIHGWDSGEITVCDDVDNPTQTETITQQFPQTIYGAEWDVVNGELKQTDGYIASYNGESLPSTWISDRDVYDGANTPTTGAEVVYKLATPTPIDLSPLSIRLLEGTNNLYADCGEVIEGEYFVDEGAIDVRKVDYTIGNNTALKISDGRILQGFVNMNNYGIFPRDASNNWLDVDWSKDFEIGSAFKVLAFPSGGNATIFGCGVSGSMNFAPNVYFWNGSTAYITLSENGSSSAVDTALNYTFQTDTWYFVRAKFTASTLNLKIEISTDMQNFTTVYNDTLAAAPYHDAASICIGGMAQSVNYASNSILIDTFNTYIKGDGVNWGAFTGVFPS